jgi:hypothetical protein
MLVHRGTPQKNLSLKKNDNWQPRAQMRARVRSTQSMSQMLELAELMIIMNDVAAPPRTQTAVLNHTKL